jgi:hypothetical protein
MRAIFTPLARSAAIGAKRYDVDDEDRADDDHYRDRGKRKRGE